ncbi:hypothetical protein [Yersinia massiliensis]|nr:hypothetical protein [Yersinia massiliensis]
MDITKSREEFEAEFRKQHAGNAYIEMLLKMYNHGTDEDPEIDYYSLAARDAWKWWKASRESLVVELPEIYGNGVPKCDEYDRAINECAEALRTAGIRIKGESE